jgi:hypothetical protein
MKPREGFQEGEFFHHNSVIPSARFITNSAEVDASTSLDKTVPPNHVIVGNGWNVSG